MDVNRLHKFLRTVRTLRETSSCSRFVGHEVFIAIGIALPKLDWAVQIIGKAKHYIRAVVCHLQFVLRFPAALE